LNSCDLLTDEEIAGVIGSQPAEPANFSASDCLWYTGALGADTTSVRVVVVEHADAGEAAEYFARADPGEPVSGLGDEAVYSDRQLWVLSGSRVVIVATFYDTEYRLEGAAALAPLVLERLP
jgi:hypothetical protein